MRETLRISRVSWLPWRGLSVYVDYSCHWMFVSDFKRGHFGGRFVDYSAIVPSIVFLSSFMLLQVSMKLFSIYWLIADDAIDCIHRFFHIIGKWAESVRICVIGWPCFDVPVPKDIWMIALIRRISWGIYLIVADIVRAILKVWNLLVRWWSWIIRSAYVGLICNEKWWSSLWPIYNWYFWFFGKGLYVLGYSEVDFSTLKIYVDFEVKLVLSWIGYSLIWELTTSW